MMYSITPEEKEIMRQSYVFLRDHLPVPPISDMALSEKYWIDICDDLVRFANLWHNHPLTLKIMPAIFEYLEDKAKEAVH